MGFWYYICMAVFVFLILAIIYDIIMITVNSQRLKKLSGKIALKKSIKYNMWWIILSALNSFLYFERYRIEISKDVPKDADLALFTSIVWVICCTFHIVNIFIDKYIYLTIDGLFFKTSIKIQPKEKYSYRVDGDILELYYKKSYKPVKYRIIANKEELVKLLEENYTPYSDEF